MTPPTTTMDRLRKRLKSMQGQVEFALADEQPAADLAKLIAVADAAKAVPLGFEHGQLQDALAALEFP